MISATIMIKRITSPQNTLIKQLIKLQEKARERRKTELFVIEGLRELNIAIEGGYDIETILFAPDIVALNKLSNIYTNSSITYIEITNEVFKKLAYRDSTEGVVAVAKIKDHSLNKLNFKNKNPLILVAEAPEKPGNIGAILRTADAANVDAVLIANPTTDLYNPNIIRSSVGCLFTNKIGVGTTTEVLSFLEENNTAVFCAALKDNSKIYYTQDFTNATAIVVGTEATGLSDEWFENNTQNIIIPMLGKIDSMNVSVAAGILIFEAVKQRNL